MPVVPVVPAPTRRLAVVFGGLAGLALALGLAVLAYPRSAPWHGVIRGHVGDVAAAMLIYAVLGLALARRWRPALRAAIAFGSAAAIEFGQLVWDARSTLAELTIGTSFDPWDIVAYAVGVALGLAWERRAVRWHDAACAPPS
ncbi:MAG: DUF2809 domain-containing protein [Deltaproteobacteria bacterium]|nr:DUF2809 domain-containing protein [Deltaproteobacteria bacterium]